MRSGVSQVVACSVLLVALCIYSASSEEVYNYENYVILSLHPQSEEHVAFIKNLDSLDIHRGAVMKGQTVEAMLSPQDFELLRSSESLPYEIKEDNVQRLIDAHYREIQEINEREKTQKRDVPPTEAFFQNYRTWDDANSYILYLLGSYPTLITRQKIGESIEGRDIYVLVVTNQTSKVTPKRLVLFNSGQHAREWLAPSTVLYSLTQLLVLQNDAVVNPLLNELEFHFIPFVNPDGYVYSQTNRMWRKNRRLNSPGVYGVDTNRNWGKAFGVGSASTSPSSETYEGTHPFSEPETQNVAVYIKSKDFRCHVDFHTYGLFILRRWASSNGISIDDSVMKEAGDAARDAVKAAGGSNYLSDNGVVLGIDGGCMPDWTYAERGMISYTIELSAGSFVLPADRIIPTGKEGYAMIKTLARFVADGKADKNKMKWKDPNTPPPPATTTTGSHPHTTGNVPPPSSSAISTADLLLVFVVLFIAVVAITVIIVAVKQYYSPIQHSPTYLGSALQEEGEEDGEELSEMRH